MIDSLTSLLTDRLSARWRNYALGSAICFALTGMAAFLWFTGAKGLACKSAKAHPWCPLAEHGELGTSTLAAVGAVVLIAVAGAVAAAAPGLLNKLTDPPLPGGLRRLLVNSQQTRRDKIYDRTHPQAGVDTDVDTRGLALLGRYPQRDLRPTRVGNALEATRSRIEARFGLDLGLCWPLFVGVLPESARARLAEQSTQILLRAQHVIYAPLTACWVLPIAILEDVSARRVLAMAVVVVLAAGLGWFSLRRLASAVDEYCDLIDATVIANRRQLYQVSGFPLPGTAATEAAHGQLLSRYLAFRDDGPAQFQWPL